MDNIKKLIKLFRDEDRVFIQPHNFPDHDAVASAFALQHLLGHYRIKADIVYEGEISRVSLIDFIKDLKIDIKHLDNYKMKAADKIIIVDGCKGNKNVTDMIGDEVAVIDHHNVVSPEDITYSDIRQKYGACSTIIADYYLEADIKIPAIIATAIMAGISMDTALLTRGVNGKDLEIYFHCYSLADMVYVNSMLRNNIQIKDLDYYKYVIDNTKYLDSTAFCYFPSGCGQNLMGILSDFLLALEEIDFVVIFARNSGRVNFSIRSEVKGWDASYVIRELLRGIGFGGGHTDMAGGVINDISRFTEDNIIEKAQAILKSLKRE